MDEGEGDTTGVPSKKFVLNSKELTYMKNENVGPHFLQTAEIWESDSK